MADVDRQRVGAAADAVESLSAAVWLEVGGSFTCNEADALVLLFQSLGLTAHADALTTGHAAQDDLDDRHGRDVGQRDAERLAERG